MATKTAKKTNVPDIGNLLGTITAKHESGELQKSPIQSVQPHVEEVAESKNSNTPKQGGRPSAKKASVEYVKISPRIPKALKRGVDMALVEERFSDGDGNPIKTLDEIVEFALARLLGRE